MGSASTRDVIRLRGVRHNNLKGFDLDLPLHRLIVVTGLSGSGKSSLAFDTLFAEGQRRYVETFSPYARQFFDRMDKPRVDAIEGIPPAIAIEQRNTVRSTRSTVGTMTELCDHLKVLWPWLARLRCAGCGQPVRPEPPPTVWRAVRKARPEAAVLVTFDLPLPEKLGVSEALELVEKQGYRRLLVGGRVIRLEATGAALGNHPARLTVVQDRLRLAPNQRRRFIEAAEQAYHFGKGRLRVWALAADGKDPDAVVGTFSAARHCAACDREYREPTAALFSFNHPLGACPACRGFGRVIEIDYDRAVPDRSRTLRGGVVKPWQSGMSADCQRDLLKFCKVRGVPVDVPFARLPQAQQRWVIDGDPDYGSDEAHEWPRAWYGVKGYFRWLESKAYKMHVRVLLSRYRAYRPCPECDGRRLQPEALLYRLPLKGLGWPPAREWPEGLTLADFYRLPLRAAAELAVAWREHHGASAEAPLAVVLDEVASRLGYLVEAGLGYLTLDRPTRSLSGGETERVNLTACLGTRLVNTLFVLDEPSVGLHPRDTDRLVRLLERLRDTGNTVVVVEHEPAVMRAADHLVDLGPGHGETGGEVVFQGSFRQLLKHRRSLTGAYLSGREEIPVPARRPVALPEARAKKPRRPGARGRIETAPLELADATPEEFYRAGNRRRRSAVAALVAGRRLVRARDLMPGSADEEDSSVAAAAADFLILAGARRHNLRDLTVTFPLNRFVCVTGVSGSGKSTLIRDVLHPLLEARLRWNDVTKPPAAADEPDRDAESPASAGVGAGEAALRGGGSLARVLLVDQSPVGRTPRSNPAVYVGAFDHLRELFARSPAAESAALTASAFSFNSVQGQCARCRGAGFEKIEMQFLSDVFVRCPDCDGRRYRPHVLEVRVTPPAGATTWSIADVLAATIEEVLRWLEDFDDARPARRAAEALTRLRDVGLGYLRLGQPLNTLSGGESQRLKLAAHLAEAGLGRDLRRKAARPTLFLFDEPTTGLHYHDVRGLIEVFQSVIEAGHSVIVIEHNLELIKCADWLIDLGPEAGEEGGRLVVAGTPEQVAACPASHTGQALRTVGVGRQVRTPKTG